MLVIVAFALLVLLGLSNFAIRVQAVDGDLDPTFNGTGQVTTPVGSFEDRAYAVAMQPDGKIVVVGNTNNGQPPQFHNDFAIVRYNTDGSLDTSFGLGGNVTTSVGSSDDYAKGVAIQPDGRIVVAGFSFNGLDNDFAVVRYNSDGSLDTSFGSGGKVTTPIGSSFRPHDEAQAVAIQADGKIVAAGYAFIGGTAYDFAVVRYETNGSLDTTFGSGGKVTTPIGGLDDRAFAVAIQTDGKIVTVGNGGNFGGFAIVRYHSNGSLDTSFGLGGTGIVTTPIGSYGYDYGRAVAIQTDGKIVLAGYFLNDSLSNDFAVVRYSTSGALDASFGLGGKVATSISDGSDIANAVAIQTDGKIVAVGYNPSSNSDFELVRYNTDGSLDASFGSGGKVTTSIVSFDVANAVAIQPDGKIIAAGYAFVSSTGDDFAVVRYDGTATLPPTLTVTNTNDSGAGSLRQTISDAASGATINFSLPTGSTITLTSGELLIDKNLTINGPGANQLTVSGNDASRVFNVAPSGENINVTISGLTIANGNSNGSQSPHGGGIFNNSTGTVNVINSTLSNNSAVAAFPCGGGIYNAGTGVLNVTGSRLSNNSASTGGVFFGVDAFGGGICNDNTGTVNVTNSTFSGNFAIGDGNFGQGGAIFNGAGTVSITNSTLSGNSAISFNGLGGAIFNSGTVSITNSTLAGNFATSSGDFQGHGAGIYNGGSGTVNVTNSTLSSNSASGNFGQGGGIYNFDRGTVNVTNSTLSSNSAIGSNGDGGGIFNNSDRVNVKNTIIALNTASSAFGPDVRGDFSSQGYNLIGKADGSAGFTNGVNNDQVGTSAAPLNPMLGSLANNGGSNQTMALLSSSPAIDRGSTANNPGGTLINTDQRGLPRPVDLPGVPNPPGGNGSDIGAFEAQSFTPQRRPLIFIPGIVGSELDNFPALSYSPNPLWPSVGHFLPSGTLLLGNPYLLDLRNQIAGVNVQATDIIRRTPPILGNQDIYKPLLETLTNDGYVEYALAADPSRLTSLGCDFEGQRNNNPNLFVFPYDWRLSNSLNAQRLKDYVTCVRLFYPDPNQKIDVVTHSMGGLVARSYLLQYTGDHHIGKLLTIAAPWLGAPKATRVVVSGDFWDSRFLNFFTKSSLKSLSEFFPSVHELMPSRAYFELVGAPPPYILDGRILSYDQMTFLLDSRFNAATPGTTNTAFHQISQDDWHDPTNAVNTSVEYHHVYGVKTGAADTVGTVVEQRLTSCLLQRCFTFWTTFGVVPTAGDGTVPTLSALRTDGLNAPGVSRATGRIKPFACATNCDHVGLVKNPDVKNEVLQILQATTQTALTEDNGEDRQPILTLVDPEIQPAYYLTVIGTASASIQENSGNSTDPLADPPDTNAPTITSYILGDQSFMSVMPVGQSYTITLRSTSNPMIIQLTQGTDTVTNQAIRYLDFTVPPGAFLRLHITPQGVDALRYDADGNGVFESTVTPTAAVTGSAAQDTEPPTVTVSENRQPTGTIVTITAIDLISGVKKTNYSLDGTTYQPYTAPFIVDPYRTPIVYAFADDNVANRSGTVEFQLTAPVSTMQFSSASYTVSETGPRVDITLSRSGDTTSSASVSFATNDAAGLQDCNVINGIASPRCDYINTLGAMSFAAGETSKSFSITIVDDSYAEGSETFTVGLTSPSGATLGTQSTATATITDNETANGPNPIDNTDFFVRQQYIDFLNREPDPPGFAAWQDVINNCPAGDTTCDRIHVSSAFFRSPEFQERGYFVYRFYPVSFGRKPDYTEFIPDLARVSGFLSPAELEAAKVAFVNDFMARPAFANVYNPLNNTQYVDTLLSTAGITHAARDFWIAALTNGTRTRAQVLREVAESTEVYNKYFNQAFVVMQYFGYLRRDPDALYLDWIVVLDTTGDFRGMVNGFMNSLEYRFRFGP